MPPIRLFLAFTVFLAFTAGTAKGAATFDDFEATVQAAAKSAQSADVFTKTVVNNVLGNILSQPPPQWGSPPFYVVIWNLDLGLPSDNYRFFNTIILDYVWPTDVKYGNANYRAVAFQYGFIDKCGYASGSSVWQFSYDGNVVCKDKSLNGNIVDCNSPARCLVEWQCAKYGCEIG